jgi:hypothetical protein
LKLSLPLDHVNLAVRALELVQANAQNVIQSISEQANQQLQPPVATQSPAQPPAAPESGEQLQPPPPPPAA